MYPGPDELPPWRAPVRIVEVSEPTLTREQMDLLSEHARRAKAEGRPAACCVNGEIERYLPDVAAAFRAARGDDWHRHETRRQYEARLRRERAAVRAAVREHNAEDQRWLEAWRAKKRAAGA